MIHHHSYFKNEVRDHEWINNWVNQLEKLNQKKYFTQTIHTALGKTQIYSINKDKTNLPAFVIFPGFRTSSLFFDLNNGLIPLEKICRIFFIETNGQPNLSDGNNPKIRTDDYGIWANEVLEKLNIQHCYVAGASFGGLVCMKLCRVAPQKIKSAFLLNPGCLQTFSLKFKNLYYNLLPIFRPTEKNAEKFLDNAVLFPPHHTLEPSRKKLLIDYEVFAIKQYKDRTEKPYNMNSEMDKVKNDVYLVMGNKDVLFPTQHSINNAKVHLSNIKEIKVFNNVGHGIETFNPALEYIANTIKQQI